MDQKYPEVTVGALVFNNEGKLFLMKSYKWNNNFVVPGGHIEVGETMEQALKREVKEETNMDIYDIDFIHYQESIFNEIYWKKKHFIFLDFSCKTDSVDVQLNDEATEFIWVSPEEALSMPLESFTRTFIKKYLEKKGD